MVDEVEDEEKYLFAWYHEEMPRREDNMEIFTDGKVPVSYLKGKENIFTKEQAAADDKKDTVMLRLKKILRKLYLTVLNSVLLVLWWFDIILKALDVE